MRNWLMYLLAASLWLPAYVVWAQIDEDDDDEDYSMYESLDYVDAPAKRYASTKIFDLSPQRIVSIHWDAQFSFPMEFSQLGVYPPDQKEADPGERGTAVYAGGPRLIVNMPVISKTRVTWQLGANYWDIRYRIRDIEKIDVDEQKGSLLEHLNSDGLRTAGINTLLFFALNEKQFLLFQGSADLSGNYTLQDFQPLNYLRYSAAALWGKRPHDRLQWAVGISRTYRAGDLNYFPLLFYNYTAPSRKWGLELLLPARGHYRRNFSPRSLLLAGYELEGQTYRIRQYSEQNRSFEIRRSELRFRVEYMKQLVGFFWISGHVGVRQDFRFHGDYVEGSGADFFRGFFGDQPRAMLNSLGLAPYANIGIHLVSP